jgi:F-type H+-transporting ATPase subunit b
MHTIIAEGTNPIVPTATELILGIVAFLVLLVIAQKIAVPMFEKLYKERTEQIEGGIEKAEKAQAEAAAALAKYQAQLAEARAESARIRDDARAEAEQIKEELRIQAQEESARILAAGQSQLAAQRAQIVAELRAELGRTSVELASRIVGESLEDEARRNGTVDRFLDELDSVSAPEAAK